MTGRINVGNVEIVVVSDGVLRDSISIISNIDGERAAALANAGQHGEIELPVNCFLLRKDGLTCLIDTGAGTGLHPTLGRSPENLAAIGVDPASVQHVLLTHLHPDHVNGLVDAQGLPAFPIAEVRVHAREAAFWLDSPVTDAFSKAQQHRMLANRTLLGAYAGRVSRVTDGEVLPGIEVRCCAGHSPGHACWIVDAGEAKVLFWGDIVHVAAVQVPHPEAGVAYDHDPAAARVSRESLFSEIADTSTIIAGAHLDAFHFLVREPKGYRLKPVAGQ